MSARILVDAFPDAELLRGRVTEVKPRPDPTSTFQPDVKVYTTLVEIEGGHDGLRPGMTAEVTILIDRLDDVISVPVRAVITYGGRQHIRVQRPDGSWEDRTVKLGKANTEYVQITEGLDEGEHVALDLRSIMTATERRDAFGPDDDQ